MTTILHLPDDLVADLQLRAEREGRGLDETVTGLLRAGLAASPEPATTAVDLPAMMLEDRARIAAKFLSGEWGVELAGFEEGRVADRAAAEIRDRTWRR
ncbi:MAG: hypothetical protein JWO56_2643 [Acidobacteria bacterium]|nr:hypothetical protein [Acidobacteriota bacterium]